MSSWFGASEPRAVPCVGAALCSGTRSEPVSGCLGSLSARALAQMGGHGATLGGALGDGAAVWRVLCPVDLRPSELGRPSAPVGTRCQSPCQHTSATGVPGLQHLQRGEQGDLSTQGAAQVGVRDALLSSTQPHTESVSGLDTEGQGRKPDCPVDACVPPCSGTEPA